MKINLLLLSTIMTCIPVTSVYAQSVTIQYGTVEGVQTVSKDARHAGGALTGGVIGALIGPRRHRGIRVLVGAGTGDVQRSCRYQGSEKPPMYENNHNRPKVAKLAVPMVRW